jgi:hypothetical protein
MAAGCTENPILAVNSDTAPGASTPTIEVVLDAGEISWRDTTYLGFVIPGTAVFRLASDRAELQARPLGRFETIPDSVFVDTVRVAVDSFSAAAIRLALDTALSTIPEAGVEISAWSLARSFDADEASWLEARAGEAWATPGGDLQTLLGTDSLVLVLDSVSQELALPDSVVIPLSVNADSLLSAWRESEGEPGFALVLSGPDSEMRISTISIRAEAVPEGVDTTVTVVRGAAPSTFIFDPTTPEATTRLRLAGLPAARIYLDFVLPDSLGPIPLRGATINRAAIEFRPTSTPDEPFPLQSTISSQAVRLLADPFVFGEKTPIGNPLGTLQPLNPDSLAGGTTMQYEITQLVALWSRAPVDSVPPLRVGIVAIPENRQFGFWEFFSRDDAPGIRPVVRLLFTPSPSFLLP